MIRYGDARPEDIAEVLKLSQDLHKLSPVTREIEYDEDVHYASLIAMLRDDETFFQVAVDNEGQIAGFMIGELYQFFYSKQFFAQDVMVYVDPEWRGSQIGPTLIKRFEQWAQDNSAVHIYIGTNIGVGMQRYVGLMEKLGYEHTGAVMTKKRVS